MSRYYLHHTITNPFAYAYVDASTYTYTNTSTYTYTSVWSHNHNQQQLLPNNLGRNSATSAGSNDTSHPTTNAAHRF